MTPNPDVHQNMQPETSTDDSSPPSPQERALRLEREKAALLQSLAGGDFSTLKARVASILNIYPHTRNSDISLALKYWETFQPDIYRPTGILPRDLFRLERQPNLVRARAKVQNESGLFHADENVRNHRKNREEEMHDAVIMDGAERRVLHIFADETGKNDDFAIVAAVWVLTGRSMFTLSRAIQEWKDKSPWAAREVHFARLAKNDGGALEQYLRVVQENREFLSFKLIAIQRAKTRRSIEEVVEKLHEHMLLRGADHEISSGRVDLPRDIAVTIDEAQSFMPASVSRLM